MSDIQGFVQDNVIAFRPQRRMSEFDPLARVETYWANLRGDLALPSRSQIDPRDLGDVLQYVFILERIAPGLARFRIAGSHLNTLFGAELRGMPISSMMRAPARSDCAVALETCFDTPSITEIPVKAIAQKHGVARDGAMILLPMTSDDGSVNRILGALHVPDIRPGTAYRLELGWPLARPALPAAQKQSAGFAEPNRPLTGTRPTLSVVSSND